MKRPRFQFSLLTQFSLLSFVTLVIIGAMLAFVLQQKLVAGALEQEANNALDQTQTIIAPLLNAADLNGLAPQKFARLDSEIHSRVLNRHVFRVKVWNTQGMLIYSDQPSLIGQVFQTSPELQQAFAGKVGMDVSALGKPENDLEHLEEPRAIEIYAPIIPADSQTVLGAYEIYVRLDMIETRIRILEQTLFSGLAVGFVVLYLVLYLIVRSASRELIRQSKDNEQLYALEQRRARDLQAINEIGRQLSGILTSHELTTQAINAVTRHLGYDRAALYKVRDQQIVAITTSDGSAHVAEQTQQILKHNLTTNPLVAQVVTAHKTIEITDVRIDSRGQLDGPDDPTLSQIALPLQARNKTLGALVISSNRANAFEQSDVLLLETLAAQIGTALENAQLYEATQQRLRQLRALRAIDHAISSTLKLTHTLDILLDQAVSHLSRLDAAALVALRDPENPGQLHVEAARNLSTDYINSFAEQITGSIAERVVEDGIPRVVGDMAHDPRIHMQEIRASEKLQSLVAVPMLIEGEQIGALVVYTRQPYTPNDDELNFYVTLGSQAAIAVQNARLYERAQRQAASLADLAHQLEDSYTATLTAMATALDVRDREPEGHVQRLAEFAGWLARASGVTDENELRAIHYGALLHDIGKLGVSDGVLNKPGLLDNDERREVQRHTEIGAAILHSIPFLHTALPLVSSHHERWDGSGYPKGLRGETIPISARIFAIIDVYDALISDRPYRQAWSEQQARDFIRAQSGTWFDPRLARVFLELPTR